MIFNDPEAAPDGLNPLVRALSGLAFALVLIGVLLGLEQRNGLPEPTDGTGGFTLFREAELIFGGPGDASHPPGADATGITVTLPHQERKVSGTSATYRLRVETSPPAPGQPPSGICLLGSMADASVWIDGQSLKAATPGSSGLREARHPQYVALPPGLAAGPHRIDLVVAVPRGLPLGLSEVMFGNGGEVRRRCASLDEKTVAQRVSGMSLMMMMGLVALAIGLIHRDRAALWFSAMAATWMTHRLLLGAEWSWIDEDLWVALLFATRALPAFPLVFFCLRFIGVERPVVERGVVALLVMGLATFVLLPPEAWQLWLVVFGLAVLGLLGWLLWQLVRFSLAQPGISGFALSTAMFFGLVANLIEIARWAKLLGVSAAPLLFFSILLLSLSIGVLLLERLARYIREEARATERLREELGRQRAQLAEDHALMQTQRERIAVLEERRRIVRDMHDGLGTQLVSASALLRSGGRAEEPLRDVVEGALQEFRIVLDVLSSPAGADPGEDAPVSLLLAKLRHRIEPALRAQGVTLEWDTDPLPGSFSMPDQARLQLLRLLQEGFANVIKHARASRVRFSVRALTDRIELEIADDGRGIPPGTRYDGEAGHGLFNMHTRAETLGALLEIENARPGTRIRLSFPLEKALG